MTTYIVPVILTGGSGTWLWPVSRSLHPKQLLPIAADRSMLQATVGRFAAPDFAAPIIVGGEEHRFLIADQLAEIDLAPAAIILEPAGRNTAATIALAAHHARSSDADAMLLIVPSDHVIADPDAFRRAVATGAAAAADGWLVTFGIAPAGPETGYGYVEVGAAIEGAAGVGRVARFVEKPDAATAAAFFAGGRHLWNGGILFRADRYLDELARHAPAVAAACAAAMATARATAPSSARRATRSSPVWTSRSTMPSWSPPTARRWCGSTSVGPTSTRGTPCGRFHPTTPPATRSTATSSRSMRRTASSASTTGRRSRC